MILFLNLFNSSSPYFLLILPSLSTMNSSFQAVNITYQRSMIIDYWYSITNAKSYKYQRNVPRNPVRKYRKHIFNFNVQWRLKAYLPNCFLRAVTFTRHRSGTGIPSSVVWWRTAGVINAVYLASEGSWRRTGDRKDNLFARKRDRTHTQAIITRVRHRY